MYIAGISRRKVVLRAYFSFWDPLSNELVLLDHRGVIPRDVLAR